MRYRRGRPVSLLGPSGADQQEAQDGCQNRQLWLGVPLWESREMLFGENAIRRPQFAKPCLMDLLCISPFIRGGPPFGTAPTQAPVGAFLRAEGFPKRRCQFESVAAQRHLSPSPSCMACTSHFRRAALWDGPYDAAIRPQKQATSH